MFIAGNYMWQSSRGPPVCKGLSLCQNMALIKLRDNGFLPSSERSKVHCKAGGTAQRWEALRWVSRMFKFHAISFRFPLWGGTFVRIIEHHDRRNKLKWRCSSINSRQYTQISFTVCPLYLSRRELSEDWIGSDPVAVEDRTVSFTCLESTLNPSAIQALSRRMIHEFNI